MLHRNTRIENWLLRFTSFSRLPRITAVIIYILFAGVLVIIEEIIISVETYMDVRKIQQTKIAFYEDGTKFEVGCHG